MKLWTSKTAAMCLYTFNVQALAFIGVDCGFGTYMDGGICKTCPMGTFSALRTATTCTPCPAGTYNPNAGRSTCTNCASGKYNAQTASTTEQACLSCGLGTFSGTASSQCINCAFGYYSDVIGANTCKKCDIGKYNRFSRWVTNYNPALHSTTCSNCPAGKYGAVIDKVYTRNINGAEDCQDNHLVDTVTGLEYDVRLHRFLEDVNCGLNVPWCFSCPMGKYMPDSGKTKCLDCVYGTRVPVGSQEVLFPGSYVVQPNTWLYDHLGETSCHAGTGTCNTYCVLNTFEHISTRPTCAAGYSWTRMSFPNSASTATFDLTCQLFNCQLQCGLDPTVLGCKEHCKSCPGGQYLTYSSSTPRCEPCAPGYFKPSEDYRTSCSLCIPNSNSGAGSILCQCDANYYRAPHSVACVACPSNSNSPVNSESWRDCKCNDGFTQEYIFDGNVQVNFNCYCDPGYYVSGGACIKCSTCLSGMYRLNCGKNSAGTCEKCKDCVNPSQLRAGCGYLSEGECKDRTELVRTPFCPVALEGSGNTELAISVRQASGLGAFSFEQVFGTDELEADFVCSKPCDGVTYDSIQCDGPFACNVKTCAEMSRTNELPRACPVVIENTDLDVSAKSVRDRKRRETCVECNQCGHANDFFLDRESKAHYYDHWGGGCVRECSKLMCSENKIWDWTASRCQLCSELRDVRLCNKRDRLALSLETRSVTGNWPLLYFPECQGESASKKLETFKYGVCAVCDAATDKTLVCTSASQYPAGCLDRKVECQRCHRAGRKGSAKIVDVFKGWWFNSRNGVFEPLHCQIGACSDSSGQFTGVSGADRMCSRPCSDAPCTGTEVLVPCRLPHDTRCESMFPESPRGHAAGLQAEHGDRYADGEVNFLNEANDMKHRRFSSFENTLLVLGDPEHEYQCVWNADGIFDSKASPAGISSVLWRPGESDDDSFKTRGTQACRVWDVAAGVSMPLLPLQNTISAHAIQESDQASSRRMLVDTEAYVLSYRFHGAFAVPQTRDVRGAFADAGHNPGPDMLHGAHVGGTGRLFLMLRMHASHATVAVTVPSDRMLHEAMWVQALMLSFAVADVTQYDGRQSSTISVTAVFTAGEKHISDQGDNFVFESFWVQDLGNTADMSSMFALQVHDQDMNTRAMCSAQDMLASTVVEIQIAPFQSRSALTNYSWIEQHHGSAVPFNVSVSCVRGLQAVAPSQCQRTQNGAAVYVRTRPYVFVPAAGIPCDACGGHCSLCTSDRTLRGLMHVMEHVSAVRADQHGPSAGLLRYSLDGFSHPLQLSQSHAMSPFGACMTLLTTRNLTHDAVLCVGSGGVLELATLAVGADEYAGAFPHFVGNTRQIILLLKGRTSRSIKLLMLDSSTQTTRIIDTGVLSAHWLSVCATNAPGESQIVALCLNRNNQLEVRFYTLHGQKLDAQGSESLLEVTFELVEEQTSVANATISFLSRDPWLSYSRVSVCPLPKCSGVFLAAAVRQVQVEATPDFEGGSRLLLAVCCGTQGVDAACANVTLPVPADSTPSFISVAFMRASDDVQHWLVGVLGTIMAVSTADSAPRIVIEMQPQSQLRDRHFVKVDPLFYSLGMDVHSAVSNAESGEIMTYLDAFERVSANTSLSAVYGLVIAPPSRTIDLKEPTVDEFAAPEPSWTLRMHRSSYHVETPGSPGLPVFERIGNLASNNEFTQLRVSDHAPAPFSMKIASFVASYEGSGINRRVAVPHAYGRYALVGGACAFMHGKPASSSGVLLIPRNHIWSAQNLWLLMQFEVQCGATLAFSCSSTPQRQLWQLRCPIAEVIIVMDTARTKATVYHLANADNSVTVLLQSSSPACLFLGAGVAWVNSVSFVAEPALQEVRRRLLIGARLQQAPDAAVPVANSWRRERIVVTLNPVEHMRVELTFRRDARILYPCSVGVDDLQLAPVLSAFPPLLSSGVLCAMLQVPTPQQLQMVGLETLIVNTTWQRVHVTVSLQLQTNSDACEYQVRLYQAASTECPAFDAPPSGIERAGCLLLSDVTNVRGAYAECQIEVPLGTVDVGVAVQPVTQSAACLLGANDSLVAWLRPYTALYSCPIGQFREAAGECVNCHDTGALIAGCPLGQRLSGCPALTRTLSRCEKCTEGAQAVAQGIAEWVASAASICAWKCKQSFFRLGDTCAPCSVQSQQCAAGQRWQECDAQQDARCVACPDLRLTMGSYANNAEYYTACQTRCLAGCYNDTSEFADGRCKRCWDRTELVLHASREQRFFALFNCSATSNAHWAPCTAEVGARVVGSDPGASDAEHPFTGSCVLACQPGWRRRRPTDAGNSTCVQCAHPLQVQLGNVTLLPLQQSAFSWQQESCAFTCILPWLSTKARGAAEDTCVLCEADDGGYLCPDGKFPNGPYCACESCDLL